MTTLTTLERRSVELVRAAGAQDSVESCPESPPRTEFRVAGRATVRATARAVAGVRRAARGLRAEVAGGLASAPPRPAGPALPAELESRARRLGVSAVGFAAVPPGLVFRDMAVLHRHAVVLLMEMRFDAIDRAPAPAAGREAMRVYAALGAAANAIAAYLRRRGFSAQAGHPLGGAVLYPALAHCAGLGAQGRNGLLVHPEYGPRHRLAAVFTNIADLPAASPPPIAPPPPASRLHPLCESCGACLVACPTAALRSEPVTRPGGLCSYLDVDRCLPFFAAHFGCGLCIRVCPLARPGYGRALTAR